MGRLLSFQLLLCAVVWGIYVMLQTAKCVQRHVFMHGYEAKIKTAKNLHHAPSDSNQKLHQLRAPAQPTMYLYLGPANGRPPMLTFARGGPMLPPLRMSLAASGVPVFGAWASGCEAFDVV
jgi:hypothetical protein